MSFIPDNIPYLTKFQEYQKSLPPNFFRAKIFDTLNIICGIVLILYSFVWGITAGTEIYGYFAVFIIICLSGYIVYIHHFEKLYRYAICGRYFHTVNHYTRDFFARLNKNIHENKISANIEDDFDKIIQINLDTISEFFTLLCRTKCNVCLKEITQDKTITTIARDKYSESERLKYGNGSFIHKLEDNTDFEIAFYGKDSRWNNCFLCNDLEQLWLKGEYKNSRFLEAEMEPKEKNGKVIDWPLPYKSCMVFPVRYYKKNHPHCCIAFLCIDSGRKNVFKFRYQDTIGSAFADVFYTLITQSDTLFKIMKQRNNSLEMGNSD